MAHILIVEARFYEHLNAVGDIDLSAFTQSTTAAGSDAEGLASAFDIGAI